MGGFPPWRAWCMAARGCSGEVKRKDVAQASGEVKRKDTAQAPGICSSANSSANTEKKVVVIYLRSEI